MVKGKSDRAARLRRKAEDLTASKKTGDRTISAYDKDTLLHELAIRQTKLELQNEKLRQAQKKLQESRDKYADLFDFAPAGYLTLDRHFHIVKANLTVNRMLGVERRNLRGRRISSFVLPAYQDTFHRFFKACGGKNAGSCEVELHRQNGPPFFAALQIAEIDDPESYAVYRMTVIDVTERRRIEEKYQRLFESMTEGFLLIEMILDRTGKPVSYRFLEANPAVESLTHLKLQDIIGKEVGEVLPNIEPYWIEDIGRVALTGEARHIERFSIDLNAWFSVLAFCPEPGKAALIFTDITARRSAEEAIQRHGMLLEGINKVLDVAIKYPTKEDLAAACLDVAEELTQSRFGFIGKLNESGLEDIAVSNPGWDACKILDPGGHRRRPASFEIHGIYGMVLSEGRGFYTNDPSHHPARIGLPEGHPPLESFLGVPLTFGGRTLGMIGVANRAGGYSSINQKILESLAPTVVEAFMRKNAEDSFRESEQKLRTSFAKTAIGFVIRDSDGRFIEANPAYCSLTGYTLKELQAVKFPSLVHPDDRTENLRLVESIHSGQIDNFAIENRYIRKDGTTAAVRKSVSAVRDENGALKWVVALVEDISERKKAEEKLEQNERRFRTLTEKTSEFVTVLDDKGKINYAIFGRGSSLHYTTEELIGRSAFELVHPDDLPGALEKLQDVIQGPAATKSMELRIRAKDGTWRWMFISGTNMLDDPVMGGIVINGRDITDRKINDEKLRQSQLDLDRAQQVGQIGSWRMDVRQNILTWSSENHRIFGVPEGTQLNYETFLEIVHPDDREFVDASWKAALDGKAYDIEHRIIVGGQIKWVREKAYMEFDDGGELRGGFGITQDITERKLLEEDLKRSRDELELRVKERTKELTRALRDLKKRSDQLRRMAAELTIVEQRERQRLAQILHDGLQQVLVGANLQLEIVNHGQNTQQELNRLKEILEEAGETSRSLAAELSPPILLRKNLCAALEWLTGWMREKYQLMVSITRCQLRQPLKEEVLLLLFQAARELLFNVVKHAGVRKARIGVNQQDGQILMSVEDEGSGFDPGHLHSMEGSSSGFGLFSISERLSLMGGKMEINSIPGHGSRFRLSIPLSPATTGTKRVSKVGQAPLEAAFYPELEPGPADREMKIRIILVDDHAVVRQGVANLIRREPDFEIVGEASDGESAVSLVREIQPDVVLMDINMPRMDGIQATQIIHEEFAAVRIIGFSVYEEESQKTAMLAAGAAAYFAKRGSSKDLIETIRAIVR